MTATELIKKLRSTQSESKKAMLNEAADLIEQMLHDLKKTDLDCTLCIHNKGFGHCNEMGASENVLCGDCRVECVCKNCTKNQHWEYRGIKHG